MARGWESKSVEEQQSQATAPKVDPAIAHAIYADRTRRRQELELQRECVLSERTSSPYRRDALSNALADIEEKLGELGWIVHL